MISFHKGSICCGYAFNRNAATGFDCLMIPGASRATPNRNAAPNSICGNGKGLITTIKAIKQASKTVCCKKSHIKLTLKPGGRVKVKYFKVDKHF